MGTDNPPNNNLNYQNQYTENYNKIQYNNSIKEKSNDYSNNSQPSDSEKLQPIRRHSNIRDSNNVQNHLSSKNVNQHNSIGFFPSQKTKNNDPLLAQKSGGRKLSQQYCADFKKSYMEGNTNSFLNHLADSLNHGIQIPREEIEKFKAIYIPKHFFDWRNVEDPKTGAKIWKNFGKVYPDKNFELKMKQLEKTTISSSELFYLKRSWFYRYLMNHYARSKNENPLIIINRNNILEDSYNQFLKAQGLNLSRPLKIRFLNEQVVDEEGVYREWYQCMFKEIMSPNKKLFILNPYKCLEPNTTLFYPKYPGMRFEIYEFIGKLVVKALADIIFIRNLNLNRVLIKSIRNRPIILDDIKYYNLNLYNQLKYINDTPIRGNKQLESIRFIWNYRDQNNNIQQLELVQGGQNIFLNDNNKLAFIDKVIYVEAVRPYEEQIKYTQKGLFSLIGQEPQGIFSDEELKFLLSGQDEIDINDWMENTIYKGEFNQNHPIIKLFWEKIRSLNKNETIKFLEFSTGVGSVPIDGFGSLKGVGGRIQKFTIEPHTNYSSENPDQYTFYKIEAKRLYNTIILPIYRSKQELYQAFNIILYNKY